MFHDNSFEAIMEKHKIILLYELVFSGIKPSEVLAEAGMATALVTSAAVQEYVDHPLNQLPEEIYDEMHITGR